MWVVTYRLSFGSMLWHLYYDMLLRNSSLIISLWGSNNLCFSIYFSSWCFICFCWFFFFFWWSTTVLLNGMSLLLYHRVLGLVFWLSTSWKSWLCSILFFTYVLNIFCLNFSLHPWGLFFCLICLLVMFAAVFFPLIYYLWHFYNLHLAPFQCFYLLLKFFFIFLDFFSLIPFFVHLVTVA